MNLVIIEGAGKKDTIKKYLGDDYEIVATKGHIRDLPANRFAVNIANNFEPEYDIMSDKKDIVKLLQQKAKKANKIYLATDPDREGEAISWHLAHILGLNANDNIRIVFNEISKSAIAKALENPRSIDQDLVDAQQARRVLDRIVGYKLSPFISKKIQPKLSAGRVQSVALKLIVDREKEIVGFVPVEYWTLQAELFKDNENDKFKATLNKFNNKKITISNKQEMDLVINSLKNNNYVVKNVKKTVGSGKPYAPYITSTMQQDAAAKLGFNLKKTSACAQQLYEGVSIGGEGKVALVTYIRTDSVRVSPDAVSMAKNFIIKKFGEKYYPKKPNFFAGKNLTQDAHEAIRPISLDRTPASVKQYLSPDNYKLYKIIYERFLASQMAESKHNSVVVEINNAGYEFKASGKTPVFDGYLAAFNFEDEKKKGKSTKEEKEDEDNLDGLNDKLPPVEVGDKLSLIKLHEAQKFTKPPIRYTEGTLVNEMEKKGVGRPATYAPTITTLSSRTYTEKDGKYLKPTELGTNVIDLLEKYFASVIEIKFTANLEEKLDEITENHLKWQAIVGEFYAEFEKQLKKAEVDSKGIRVEPKPTNEICEKCGSPMVIRTGRYGEFLACSNYPACKNIRQEPRERKVVGTCPKCAAELLERKSKRGTIFYGCATFPKCDFVSWEIPYGENCPKCNQFLTYKQFSNKKRIKCSNSKCDYTKEEI